MNLHEIGTLVRERRDTLGLSQDRLAKLAGLSRATINQLETGALVDLGVIKLACLLELVGLTFEAHARATPHRGLLMASRTASVSYKSSSMPVSWPRRLRPVRYHLVCYPTWPPSWTRRRCPWSCRL